LGRWDSGICASAGGADDANNVSGAGYYFPGEYGEQRQGTGRGRRSEDEEFERIVEVEQRRKHAAKEKRR